jgi:alpha-L-rhamnosidase
MNQFSNFSRWATPPDAELSAHAGTNSWFVFRTVIPDGAACAPLWRIAVDSKYWLYINGQLVIREGGLKRGPVPDGSYYDAIDVSPFLEAGPMVVAVLVWFFGRHGFSHRDSGIPGLLLDVGAPGALAWKSRRHPAYFDAGYVHDAYRLSENSVGFDARHDIGEWSAPRYDDSGWPDARDGGAVGAAPWGVLEPRPIPQWYWSELTAYQAVEAQPSANRDGYVYYRCRLPHNAQFVPGLKLAARAGIRIDMTAAQDTNRLCPVYITKDGEQSYESIGWMNGEEVIYKVPSNAIQGVEFFYRETSYAADFAGSFSCDQDLLNALWEKARRTLYVTMRDTFMDCPCRERAQWPGDLVLQLGQVHYCLAAEADSLVKKGLRETLRWQLPDGSLYGPVPEGNWRMELPSQMLAVVSPYGIWNYYMDTADMATLQELYAAARRYLDIWQFQANGLVQYRPDERGKTAHVVDGVSTGIWDWIDWGERIDAEPSLNAWFVLGVRGVRLMAEELGKVAEASALQAIEDSVNAAIRTQFWDEARGGFASPGFEYSPDDRVQALCVLCGAATAEHYPALAHIFATVTQACPYMEKYVLEALFRMGMATAALTRMRDRFRVLVANDNSTLWERWPEWSNHPGTINHSWSGGPLTLLSREVAGIRPLAPGWRQIALQPAPGDLSHFAATVRVNGGLLTVAAERTAAGWHVAVSVPPGVEVHTDFTQLGEGDVPPVLTSGHWQGSLHLAPADNSPHGAPPAHLELLT